MPTGAVARKTAWQITSLSGQYSLHTDAATPVTCGNRQSESGVVLNRDYKESFHSTDFASSEYAAKYNPFLQGPGGGRQGQAGHLLHQGQTAESYRVFTEGIDANGNTTCSQADRTCSSASSRKTHDHPIFITRATKTLRVGRQVTLIWDLGLGSAIGDCIPQGDLVSELQGAPVPDPDAFPRHLTTHAPLRRFARRRSTYSLNGTTPVNAPGVLTGTLSWSATLTLKKLVIRDGCRDPHPQHLFVCSL